jgi:Domain of unknown function (DUF4476)
MKTKNFTKLTLSLLGICAFNLTQAAEFFIKIDRPGQHTVLVKDQYQTNMNNFYRFFDLPTGTISVKVSDGNTGNLVYDGTVTLGLNERVVTEMNANGNLTIISTSKVTYANWYTEAGTAVAVSTPAPPPAPAGPVAISSQKFNEIKKVIDDQAIETNKCDKAKSVMKKNFMTSKQIAEICKLFNFDNYKLDYAKFAYDYCVDKDNYHLVSASFTFDSYGRDLDAYIDKKD